MDYSHIKRWLVTNQNVIEESIYYLFHKPIVIPRRDTGYTTSNLNRQVFPVSNYTDAFHNVYFIGDGNQDGIDRTYVTRKSISDGLHPAKGWAWYDDNADGEPTIVLGQGGYTCEKKAYINVRCATTGNITLSGEQTINTTIGTSKSVVTGERVLVKNQTTASQNGVYVVAVGAWTRATDADETSELQDLIVRTTEGATVGDGFWYQTTQNPTVGSSNIVFSVYQWNTMQNFLGQALPKDGGGYVAVYGANGPIISSAYSLGAAESTDLITWTRSSNNPLVQGSGSFGCIHPRMIRIGSTLHIFTHDFTLANRTEGRVYAVRYYTTTWNDNPNNWSLTLRSTNLFHGKILQENCLGEMSTLWIGDDGLVHFYSSRTSRWAYPANQGRVTQSSIQATICEFAMDLTDPSNVTFTTVGDLFTTSQLADIAHIGLCGKMTHGGKNFTPITGYKWRGKATLTTESEPFTNVKILTTARPEDAETIHANGEVWPKELNGGYLFRVDQAQEATLSPIEARTKTPLTVVGSPTRAFYSGIQPVSGGYVQYTGSVLNTTYFGIKFLYTATFDASTFSMFTLVRQSDNKVVMKVETFGSRLRVTLTGSNGTSQKIYRMNSTITTADPTPSLNADTRIPFMILWRNGTLQLGVTYNSNVTVIKDTDNAFTDIFNGGDTFKIGVGSVDTDFCKYSLGTIMVLNGSENATWNNLINLDVM